MDGYTGVTHQAIVSKIKGGRIWVTYTTVEYYSDYNNKRRVTVEWTGGVSLLRLRRLNSGEKERESLSVTSGTAGWWGGQKQ